MSRLRIFDDHALSADTLAIDDLARAAGTQAVEE